MTSVVCSKIRFYRIVVYDAGFAMSLLIYSSILQQIPLLSWNYTLWELWSCSSLNQWAPKCCNPRWEKGQLSFSQAQAYWQLMKKRKFSQIWCLKPASKSQYWMLHLFWQSAFIQKCFQKYIITIRLNFGRTKMKDSSKPWKKLFPKDSSNFERFF